METSNMVDRMWESWTKYCKDDLDKKCDLVFDALHNEQTVDDKIALLEQCLDYLRMEKICIEEECQNENAD